MDSKVAENKDNELNRSIKRGVHPNACAILLLDLFIVAKVVVRLLETSLPELFGKAVMILCTEAIFRHQRGAIVRIHLSRYERSVRSVSLQRR